MEYLPALPNPPRLDTRHVYDRGSIRSFTLFFALAAIAAIGACRSENVRGLPNDQPDAGPGRHLPCPINPPCTCADAGRNGGKPDAGGRDAGATADAGDAGGRDAGAVADAGDAGGRDAGAIADAGDGGSDAAGVDAGNSRDGGTRDAGAPTCTLPSGEPDLNCDGVLDCETFDHRPDLDCDGVADDEDNCPTAPNGKGCALTLTASGSAIHCFDSCAFAAHNVVQPDLDNDGIGDACDFDIDGDGALNQADGYPADPRYAANDSFVESFRSDSEGCGDYAYAGDGDYDHDGAEDRWDNCRYNYNSGQTDQDHDGKGDECDHDIDGDGVENGRDNCLRTPNFDQVDRNGNGTGDRCE